MTKITVAKRGGIEQIHKPGCRDLKRGSRYDIGRSDRDDWTLDVETLRDLYEAYWDCIADESVGEGNYPTLDHAYWAWRGEFELMSCAGKIPEMDEPGVDSYTENLGEPATATARGPRTANQELAAWLVDLVAANAGDKTADEKQKLANWLHHLPTGGAGADRYWPEGFNRPSQTDWRK